MIRKLGVLMVGLLLLLSACSGEENREPATPYERASGIPDTEILLTADGREQCAWRYFYWLERAGRAVIAQYQESGETPDWNAVLENGGTLADDVKRQALEDTVLYATVENWGELYGCTAAGEGQWKGETCCLTETQCRELATVGELYAALYRMYCTPESLLAPEEGEIEQFAADKGYLTVDRILIPFGEDRDAARRRAEEIFAALNTAEEKSAAFSALAAETADRVGARTLCAGAGTMDPALERTAATLAEGQISGILETEEGFSVLLRLPIDAQALRETYFDGLLQSAAENAEVQTAEAYEKIDLAVFMERICEDADRQN